MYSCVEKHLELYFIRENIEQYAGHLQCLVKEQVDEILKSQMSTILSLAKLAESRDDETGKHIKRVQAYCRFLAKSLLKHEKFIPFVNEVFVERIYYASALHDIGKVGIPDALLLKPWKLTAEEFLAIKKHTIIGADTLDAGRRDYARNPYVNMGINIVRYHHEHWDAGATQTD